MKETPHHNNSELNQNHKESDKTKRYRTLNLFQEEIDAIVQNLLVPERKDKE